MLQRLPWRRQAADVRQPEQQPNSTDPQPEPRSDPAAQALGELLQHQAQLAEAAEAIASGNLARDVVVRSDGDTLGVAFRDMVAGLRRLVGQVKDTAAEVESSSRAADEAMRSADASVLGLHDAIETIARGAAEQMTQVQSAAGAIAHVSGAG